MGVMHFTHIVCGLKRFHASKRWLLRWPLVGSYSHVEYVLVQSEDECLFSRVGEVA